MDKDRRRILQHSTAAVATLGLAELGLAAPATKPAGAPADVQIELRAVRDQVAVRLGNTTAVWRYQGKLLRGASGSLEPGGGYLGPTIRVRRGQRVQIEFTNDLPEPTTVHWHGLHVPDDMDGHPRHAVAPGQRFVYEFPILNRAGTYWYHAHPHGRTGFQIYHGLAGMFLVSDEEEQALALPRGPHDIALVLQDRNFDRENQFVYPSGGMMDHGMMGGGMRDGGMRDRGMWDQGMDRDTRDRGMVDRRMSRSGMGDMMASMMGVLGEQLLVSGRQMPRLQVERRPYRLRLANGSNTRTYKLGWSDGSPVTVLATDGGLLAAPRERPFVMLAPAERVELWVDFARWPAGADLALHSLAFDPGMMMMMMMGGGALPNDAEFPVLTLDLRGGGAVQATPAPRQLSQVPAAQAAVAINADRPKVFDLTMDMMAWGINGRSFDMLEASAEETVKLGTHEIWEFRNDGRRSMGEVMAHSMHIHGLQFRVLGREVSDRFAKGYRTVRAGLVDEGWKDTVLVMPGERVRVLVGFEDYPGLFIYHCHMLEHEDTGMMRNYLVKA